MSCSKCQCPPDAEWLPCSPTTCRQEERQYRLRHEYITPLPESDDEDAGSDEDADAADAYAYALSDITIYIDESIHSSSAWIEYRRSLSHLVKFPHIYAEAEAIRDAFALKNFKPITMARLIDSITAMKKAEPSNMFARSLIDSVYWHIKQMRQCGIVQVAVA